MAGLPSSVSMTRAPPIPSPTRPPPSCIVHFLTTSETYTHQFIPCAFSSCPVTRFCPTNSLPSSVLLPVLVPPSFTNLLHDCTLRILLHRPTTLCLQLYWFHHLSPTFYMIASCELVHFSTIASCKLVHFSYIGRACYAFSSCPLACFCPSYSLPSSTLLPVLVPSSFASLLHDHTLRILLHWPSLLLSFLFSLSLAFFPTNPIL